MFRPHCGRLHQAERRNIMGHLLLIYTLSSFYLRLYPARSNFFFTRPDEDHHGVVKTSLFTSKHVQSHEEGTLPQLFLCWAKTCFLLYLAPAFKILPGNFSCVLFLNLCEVNLATIASDLHTNQQTSVWFDLLNGAGSQTMMDKMDIRKFFPKENMSLF